MNNRASNGASEHWKRHLDRSLFRSQRVYREPKSFEELKEQLSTDIFEQVDAMISIGGDGTVNTLIQSLANTKIGLLVIPGGTANDLARELGNTTGARKLVECIRNEEFKYIDLININGRYMATNGGFGIGGEVARKINELRTRFPLFKKVMKFSGKKVYSFFIASEMMSLNYELKRYSIVSDQFTGEVESAALLINNQPMVAGTFNVAPYTSNADGTFNVTIIKHKTRQKLLRCMLALAAGYYPSNDPDFISFESKHVIIKALDEDNTFFGDGEIFDRGANTFEITLAPKALKVYTPCTERALVSLCNEVSLA
jgi:diacylglycerol kinase family enzyme